MALLGNGDIASTWIDVGSTFKVHSVVDNIPADGVQNVATPLTTLNGAVTDTDGSETLSYILSGFPTGTTFNYGALDNSTGKWVISSASDISALKTNALTTTVPTAGAFTLTIDAQTTDTATLSTGTVTAGPSHAYATINVGIKDPNGFPLEATSGGVASSGSSSSAVSTALTQSDLAPIVAQAVANWERTGLTEAQDAYLKGVSFSIDDLAGNTLGAAVSGAVTLDADAAGYGWFVDPTPADSAEFPNALAATDLTTDASSAPAGHIDLLTTVEHELGHELGLDDTYADADRSSLMYGYITQGERRLPAAGQAAGATPGDIKGQDFAMAPIDIGDIPAGESVTVVYDSTVDPQTNQPATNPTSQGAVSSANAASVTTNADTVAIDTLTLGNLVFNDANRNGVFDAGDSGIAGVALSLYADTNGNGTLDAGDTRLASTGTATDGSYAFAGLAPGHYIVAADASNFAAGGALAGDLVAAADTTPDDDVDNDNNGSAVAGFGVATGAITLAYNTEPTADATGHGDINRTLDIGVSADRAPTIAGTVANQPVDDTATAMPFAGVTVADADTPAQAETVTVTLSQPGYGSLSNLGGGGYDPATGVYTFAGTAAAATTALRGLVFTPVKNQISAGATETEGFTVAASDGIAPTASDATTSLVITSVDDAPSAPVDADATDNRVRQGAASGTRVGITAASSDPDPGTTIVYSLIGDTSNGGFAIDPTTGVVTVADPSKIDYAAAPNHAYTLTAQASDGMLASSQSFAVAVDAPPTGTVSFDPGAAFVGHGTFLLTGHTTGFASAASVEISADVDGVETDLGAATVRNDGSFVFRDRVGPHEQGFITATAADAAGGTSATVASFTLAAGLQGAGYVAREDQYGSGCDTPATSTLFRSNGSSTVELNGQGQTVTSNAFDVFENHGLANTHFVFDPGFGIDAIRGFRVAGPGHDTIDLPASDFKGIADMLRHTGDIQGSAWITDPKTGDAIRIVGVTTAELKAHPKDFTFHV